MTFPALSVERLLEAGVAVGPVLGLETGGPVASLGVVARGRIQAVLSRPLISHCAGLPDAVNEVLDGAGFKLRDLAAIAVGIGPGSFTGLRVGLSYAKGLVSALGMAIVGVSSLEAIALCAAREARAGMTVCPIIDARRGELYTALYRSSGDALERVTGDLAVSVDELAARLSGDVIVVGEAMGEEVRTAAQARGYRIEVVTGAAELSLRGSLVAVLGAGRVASHEIDHAATLEPLYVRAADAQVKSSPASNNGASGNSEVKPEVEANGTSRRGIDPALRRA
ncbi:MAG TPA: tRNA (adenosine(37)-N6)-threonylcarbamoyltransferase complex dimerization subunit type 1 TsaB [Candidatus Binataceae bacterium]|nr:tRNA (adenosine(37)-N6)-threonylcarbamoyltransferase complex dimerization subunit type 1 TsaB [Candidatus Binataceae bacterium]